MHWMKKNRVSILIMILILLSGCNFENAREEVTLYCPACAGQGVKINLWATPDEFVVKSLATHNDVCEIIDKDTVSGQLYYKVECDGPAGWVSQAFIKEMNGP